MGEPEQPGWHPDPHNAASEAYWTGTEWAWRRQSQATGKKSSKTRMWVQGVLLIVALAIIVGLVLWLCGVFAPSPSPTRTDDGVHTRAVREAIF